MSLTVFKSIVSEITISSRSLKSSVPNKAATILRIERHGREVLPCISSFVSRSFALGGNESDEYPLDTDYTDHRILSSISSA